MGESLPGPMAASLAACDRIASLDGDIQDSSLSRTGAPGWPRRLLR